MAEARTASQTRYFCHQCADSIFPDLPDFTCPQCHSGFIEELGSDDLTDNNLDGVTYSSSSMQPAAAQFAELWERTLLDNFREHANDSSNNVNFSAGHTHANSGGSQQQQPPHQLRPNRIQLMLPPSRRRGDQAFSQETAGVEFIINHLLQTLTQGGLFPAEAGGGGMAGVGALGGGIPLGLIHLHGNPGDYAWGTDGLDAIVTQLLNQLEGSGPPPASKTQIELLPTRTITEADVVKALQCSVCMEDYKVDEQVRCLPCQHVYHHDCIVPWLQRHGNCPVCRKDMDGKDTSAHIDDDTEPPAGAGGAPNGFQANDECD